MEYKYDIAELYNGGITFIFFYRTNMNTGEITTRGNMDGGLVGDWGRSVFNSRTELYTKKSEQYGNMDFDIGQIIEIKLYEL